MDNPTFTTVGEKPDPNDEPTHRETRRPTDNQTFTIDEETSDSNHHGRPTKREMGRPTREKASVFSLGNSLQGMHDSFWKIHGRLKARFPFFWPVFVYVLFTAHFAYATYYFIDQTDEPLNVTMCNGFGFLMILYIFVTYGAAYALIIKPYIIRPLCAYVWKPARANVRASVEARLGKSVAYLPAFGYLVVLVAVVVYLVFDTSDNRRRLISVIGLVVFLLLGLVCSKYPGQIYWRPVIWGLILQFAFGLLTIRWATGRDVFRCIGDKVTVFLQYAVQGSAFVYGDKLVNDMRVFAFQALATIYFLNFMINILYHYGIMQRVVVSIGLFLRGVMGTSICESVNSAANIFLGQSEAPLLLKPYLADLTASEIHSILTSGFATVSGSVLAAYISFGAKASHLITSSVMSAPAALCYSKLIYPETEPTVATKESIKMTKSQYTSVLDAASQGASQATYIVLGIIANLIAFIAFIYFVNGVLGWMGILCGFDGKDDTWSVELIVGYIFTPVSYIMGVPWDESHTVGRLIGIKMMVNEFAAFEQFGREELRPRTQVIATYAICGFANPGSIGMMISALSQLIPEKTHVVTDVIIRAFIGGSLVCFMTACIAAVLIPEDLIDI